MHRRYVKYTNSIGQTISFGKNGFLCEKMEISKAPARYNAYIPISGSGQITSGYDAAPLPIKLQCALVDAKDHFINRQFAMDVFTPLSPGVITVINDDGEYSIEAHLISRPEFVRAGSHSWRWEAEFIADFPYWKKGEKHSMTLSTGDNTVYNNSPVSVPVEIKIFYSGKVQNSTIGQSFNHSAPPPGASYYTVYTENFKVIDNNGNDCNNRIISGDIGDIVLVPGNNTILSTGTGTVLYWQELRGGVL